MDIDSFLIFFQHLVKTLPQLPKIESDKTNCYTENTAGLLESQLKKNRFLYALVHNRKKEIKSELRKIAKELNIFQITEGDVNSASMLIRNLFMTSCKTKSKILSHLGKLSRDEQREFFKSLETISVDVLLN